MVCGCFAKVCVVFICMGTADQSLSDHWLRIIEELFSIIPATHSCSIDCYKVSNRSDAVIVQEMVGAVGWTGHCGCDT